MVIKPQRRGARQIRRLEELRRQAQRAGDLRLWKRVTGVLSYLAGKPVPTIAEDLQVTERTPFQWLWRYNVDGLDGLREGCHSGRPARLSSEHHARLEEILDSGPLAYGFDSGLWTGTRVAQVIAWEFRVGYHSNHVCKLLHQLGFSVQRPSRYLARKDTAAQQKWERSTLPRLKRGPRSKAP